MAAGYTIHHESLAPWGPIFEDWTLLVQKYCRKVAGDAPYYYNERANVGLLAAAIARCNWPALEEFPNEKKVRSSRSDGRVDLFAHISGSEFWIEAKQGWINLGGRLALENSLKAIDEAVADIKRCEVEAVCKLGIAFLVPHILRRKAQHIDAQLEEYLNRLGKEQLDAFAWCFPEETKMLEGGNGYIYPGVVLAKKRV